MNAMTITTPTLHRGSLRLSHSRKQTMVTCGRKYRLQYVDRLEPIVTAGSLVFGSAMHAALAQYLTATAFGLTVDPVAAFDAIWTEANRNQAIEFSTGWSPEDMQATGRRLLERFLEDWPTRGWTVAVDRDGVPLVERELTVRLPNQDTYIAIVDVVVQDQAGKTILLDFKTPASASTEAFVALSDQLLGYQAVVDAHADALGIGPVQQLGFYELLKKKIPKTARGEGPTVDVRPTGRRSAEDITEFMDELGRVARDIREGRFAKRPMDAFNSPCALCPYTAVCTANDRTGMVVREGPRRAA